MLAAYVLVDSGRLRTETLNLPELTIALKIEAPMLPLAWFGCQSHALREKGDLVWATDSNHYHILDYFCHFCYRRG
jgi:hypothetical protein